LSSFRDWLCHTDRIKTKSSTVETALSQEHPQTQSEEYPEPITVARLEQLRANYEAALKAGRWHKPLMTEEQRQAAAELLADLALVDEQEPVPEGAH
jgi:tRNA uridine 5-carbamoylmethylation protein Kti12